MKTHFLIRFVSASLFFYFLLTSALFAQTNKITGIFPIPQECETLSGFFDLDEETVILLPEKTSENDLFLARSLVSFLSDRYGLALRMERAAKITDGKSVILMGSLDNPLVKTFCKRENVNITPENPGSEGYILHVRKNQVIVAGCDNRGAFYGLQSLRQIIKEKKSFQIPCIQVRDWPHMPFRGIRLYIPGRDNIPFFKRFIRDFMALYKYNKVILEVNACMRFDKHPELNAGAREFAKDLHYTRRGRPAGPNDEFQDSAHHDAGDGDILEKQEVKDLVQYARKHYIDVIPEIPSLTHTYYMLTQHRDLAEVSNAEWPDTYCPSNPDSYKLLFDIFDEYIEVIQPNMIHIGHDEWRMDMNVCPRCKGKDYTQLFARDVNKIYDYLTAKGIKVAMWGDHFLESVRERGFRERISSSGYKYNIPGGLAPDLVKEAIPKDILIFNWFWGEQENDQQVNEFGFKQIYGNFKPNISDWSTRVKEVPVLGGAPSSWAATTEFNIGKDLLYDFLGCANLLWSQHKMSEQELTDTVQYVAGKVRRNLSGKSVPSEEIDSIAPVDIAPYCNLSLQESVFGTHIGAVKSGPVRSGNQVFELINPQKNEKKSAVIVGSQGEGENPYTRGVKGLKIDKDVSSVIFLHASARSALNSKAYRKIYNFDDTSDLLGWYEIVYEDEYIETIPIRYGVNILEWNAGVDVDSKKWEGKTGAPQNTYCYMADPVNCSSMQENPVKFYAFEWVNTRFGKKIKEIHLKGTVDYRNYKDEIIPANAIILAAVSVVEKKDISTARAR